ncbi:MAG: hypothetical protein GY696_04150, partial [Gammaproteobacteria bacterium]|nr:hypothetical protein [Gammaproteobacteria bacterium]
MAFQQSNGGTLRTWSNLSARGQGLVPVHRTSQSLSGQGVQDLDWTLDLDLQSGARPVSDQILQPDRSTSRSHCPRRTDATFQTRIPGRAGKEQT